MMISLDSSDFLCTDSIVWTKSETKMISCRMRMLSRLLIEMRKTAQNDKLELKELISPDHFEIDINMIGLSESDIGLSDDSEVEEVTVMDRLPPVMS